MAGYQFNKRLSFETGAFVEKKYYSSDGKYFDMSKVMSAMPTGMKVISLEGSSSLFEFSAGLSYNFLLHNNHQLYFKAGASTYVLTQEYNKYQAVIDGTAQHINGSYNSTKKYFAAALNLNLGYQKQITRNAAVRIEPYLQIPTKGIGVGALPVTTVGLHIGFIHSL